MLPCRSREEISTAPKKSLRLNSPLFVHKILLHALGAVLAEPEHEYTRALMAAIPRLRGPKRRRLSPDANVLQAAAPVEGPEAQ